MIKLLLSLLVFQSTSFAADNKSQNYLEFVKSKLRCREIAKNPDKVFWDNSIELMFENDELVSYKIKASYNCDGVITNQNIDHSFNYDKKIGKLFHLSDFFKTNTKFLKYIRSRLYQAMSEPDCRDKISFYIEGEDFLSKYLHFYMNENSLFLSPVLPQGIKSCFNSDIKIAYSELLENVVTDNKFEEIFKLKKEKK